MEKLGGVQTQKHTHSLNRIGQKEEQSKSRKTTPTPTPATEDKEYRHNRHSENK